MNQYAQLVRESEMKELLTPCDRLEKLAKEILLDFKYLDTQVILFYYIKFTILKIILVLKYLFQRKTSSFLVLSCKIC